MKFSNRLEAYLSWISTGIKPEDFDDEPRNMTEYWLQGEADRLDRMSGNEAPVATRNLKRGVGDEKYDYADLENKPIQPYVEGDELVENKYYFTLKTDEEPTNIFQYVDGEQRPLVVEGEASGTGLYDHQIKIVKDSYNQLFIQILSTSKDAWVYSDIVSFLRSLNDADYKAYGWSEVGLIDYIGLQSGSLITGYHVGSDYSLPLNEAEVTITDNVIKL